MKISERNKNTRKQAKILLGKKTWLIVFLVLFFLFALYTGIQIFSPLKYCGMIREVLLDPPTQIRRTGDEVLLDFSETDIAENHKIQEWICEQLTPTEEYVFMINENAPILDSFTHVNLSLDPVSLGQYNIYITTYPVKILPDGNRESSLALASYHFRVHYNPLLFSWRVQLN